MDGHLTSQLLFLFSDAGRDRLRKDTPELFFGSTFLVMPNAIDVCQTAELFATFEDNPVVVTTVSCLCVAYVLVVIWARRKDAQDQAKVRLHDL